MTSPFLLGGLAALFAAFVLLVLAVAPAGARREIDRSLAAVAVGAVGPTAPLPFRQRVLVPVLERFGGLGRALSPAGTVERLARQLDLAGNPRGWGVERLLAAKGAALVAFAASGAWLLGAASPARMLVVGFVAAVAGFFLPDVLVYNAGVKRQLLLEKSLADALDLLTISVEAGLGFDAALAQVARNTDGPLSGEVFRLLQEMQIGKSRAEAFRGMGERTTVADLKTFVSSLVQADNLGIPMARVLREQAKEMRLKRRQRAEEQAMKVPVKILFPMVVFILPVLFVILMGPGALSIIELFS